MVLLYAMSVKRKEGEILPDGQLHRYDAMIDKCFRAKDDPRMESIKDYSEFVNRLTTKPRWIARAVLVLTHNPHVFNVPSEVSQKLLPMAQAILTHGGKDLPWTLESKDGRDARKLVRRFAPNLYKYSKAKQEERLEREATSK